MDFGDVSCVIRFEVDCVDSQKQLLELKSMREIAGKNDKIDKVSFYLDTWIQMVLSNIPKVRIGRYEKKNSESEWASLKVIEDMSIEAVQDAAHVTDAHKEVLFQNLVTILENISQQVVNGQVVFRFTTNDYAVLGLLPPHAEDEAKG